MRLPLIRKHNTRHKEVRCNHARCKYLDDGTSQQAIQAAFPFYQLELGTSGVSSRFHGRARLMAQDMAPGRYGLFAQRTVMIRSL